MQFKEGASVCTADGQQVGSIDRVVLDPRTHEVSHVVMRQGWLFTEDKVLPIDMIDVATEDRVQLQTEVENLGDLPRFEEAHYLPYDSDTDESPDLKSPDLNSGHARALYWYPPFAATWPGYYSGCSAYPPTLYPVEIERNIPKGMVALKEGATVVTADGARVGHVARVFTDNKNNQITHLLIAEGWLFKEKKIVPINWVDNIGEHEVHLAVDTHVLEGLPAFQGSSDVQ